MIVAWISDAVATVIQARFCASDGDPGPLRPAVARGHSQHPSPAGLESRPADRQGGEFSGLWPTTGMGSQRGQAAPEYIAMLGVVAILLLTGAAVARPDIARAAVANLRTALCVVGGDVCRGSEAAAAGLEPCVVSSDSRSRRTGLTVLFLRGGDETATLVERRSDGSVAVMETGGKDLGANAALNVSLGPVGRIDAGGRVTLKWRSGKVWELADEASLHRLMRSGGLHRTAPTATYVNGGAAFDAEVAGSLLGAALPLDEGSVGDTIGRRIGPEGTTWFLEASVLAPRLLGSVAGGARAWTLEVTERDGSARELVVRGVRGGDVVEELSARLDLRDPGNRAVARDLLGLRPPWTPAELMRIATIGRHMLSVGTVERRVYRERTVRDRDWRLSVGPAGFDHVKEARRRDLVAATIHGADGRVTHRYDCAANPAARV